MERLFGINSVHARLMLGSAGVDRVLLRDGKLSPRLEMLQALAQKKGVKVERISSGEFDKLTDLNHQGAGVVAQPIAMDEQSLLSMIQAIQFLLPAYGLHKTHHSQIRLKQEPQPHPNWNRPRGYTLIP